MSSQALAIENAIVAALNTPSPVAARVARGDAFALPLQLNDGVLVRLTSLSQLDAAVNDDSALAVWDCEIELHKLGPTNQSAVQALSALMTSAHVRLMADRSLSGNAQRIVPANSDFLKFETTTGGELPVHTATMRYEIYSNINPQTLGA